MSDIIRIEDRYYILASSSLADIQPRVLKQDETFAIYDHHGDILSFGPGEQGVYHQGTRFLSSLRLLIEDRRPLLLSSTVIDSNELLAVDLTNPAMAVPSADGSDAELQLLQGALHCFRSRFLGNGVVYERLRVTSYADRPVLLRLCMELDADFIDIFEVRGMKRARRGRMLAPVIEDARVVLGYRGLDGVERRTRFDFAPRPLRVQAGRVDYELALAPDACIELYLTMCCEIEATQPRVSPYAEAYAAIERSLARFKQSTCAVRTSDERLNAWIERSLADLYMLVTDTGHGPYPYAGVPWYSTVFGRDGIITALECLWANPSIARGVLCTLAAMQASELDPERDAEPGKILHEARSGEMAACREIPFDRYYGTVDATPLFVMLAGAYVQRTDDWDTLDWLWPHVERALAWLDEHGDRDRDGFVEYGRSVSGLANQGWKDSGDSVFHASGELAEPPIALCEVQGYVYAARQAAAMLAEARGDATCARRLRQQAETLRARFDDVFWCEDLGTYALALDRAKRPCRVRTSNPGHCLYTGIAWPERARVIAQTMLSDDMFSGWGVRTLAASERRYNPMSYHNGSVWPHDNAILIAGLCAYGETSAASRIADGLFDASRFFELYRVPELFCGFVRRRGEGPTAYPLACSPQAWSAATVFLLLQSLLGLSIDAPRKSVRCTSPALPPSVDLLELHGLQVGDARLSLGVDRHPGDVSVRVLKRDPVIEVIVLK